MADSSVKLPKPKFGQIVVLQKNGDEPRGHGFPLISNVCVVGRCETADIRVSSADVSLIHCKFQIDEVSGEASLEVLGNETQVNEIVVDPVTTIKLKHRDVILIGGRRLRFEYLPPDFKPLPSKASSLDLSDSLKAEVVDREENGDVVDNNSEKEEEEVVVPVPCTPSGKRVSFGPYLSPEQFDNTLPPATPIKKGATPRRSTRYSGLKFTRPNIDPLIEEDCASETPAQDQSVKEDETSKSDRLFVEDSIISEDQEATSTASVDETANDSPSLALPAEYPDMPTPANADISSIDAMSTMSDVSNIAVVPSECCSFLDEPIEEDFGPEVSEHESLSQMEDSAMYDNNEDLMTTENVPEISTSQINGTGSLTPLSTSTSRVDETVGEEEEGITLSPEDMSEKKNDQNVNADEEKESKTPSSPQADYTDVRGVKQLMQTPKPAPSTPKADYTNVEGVKQLLKTPKNAVAGSPQADYTNVDGVKKLLETPKPPQKQPEPDYTDVEGVQDLLKTPKAAPVETEQDSQSPGTPKASETNGSSSPNESLKSPEKSPATKTIKVVDYAESSPEPDHAEVLGVKELTPKSPPQSPKADNTNVEGVKKLLETPKPVAESPKADYTDVDGVKQLLETPKTNVVVAATTSSPQADYTDVRGVKQLLQTPKPPPSTPKADYRDVRGIKRLLRTPKAAGTPKADYTDVEGVERLMKTPKAAEKEEEVVDVVVEQVPDSSGQPTAEDVVEEVVEEEVSKPVNTPRGKRIVPTPKTKTPKSRSKLIQSEPEKEEVVVKTPEVEETSEEPAAEVAEVSKPPEEPVEEVASTPRRGRKAAPTPKTTPRLQLKKKPAEEKEAEIQPDVVEETVTATPRRGRREAPTPKQALKRKPSDAESVPEEKPVVAEESTEESVEVKPSTPPRRGRRPTPKAKVDTPKPRSKRSKLQPEEAESTEKEVVEPIPEETPAVVEEDKSSTTTEEADNEPAGTPRRVTTPETKVDSPKLAEESGEVESTEVKEDNVPVPVAVVEEDNSSTTTEEADIKTVEEEAKPVAGTRGRRATAPKTKADTPKPVSKRAKLQPEEPEEAESTEKDKEVVEPIPEETPVVGEEDNASTTTEEADNKVVEEVAKPVAGTRGRRATAPKTKADTPKPRSKRGKLQPEEPEEAEDVVEQVAEEVPVAVEDDKSSNTTEEIDTEPMEEVAKPVAGTPRRGRRAAAPKAKVDTPKPRSRRTKRQSDSESHVDETESTEKKDAPEEELVEEEAVAGTPRRGRRPAASKAVARPKRTKRQSDSDAGQPEETESAEKESRPLRSKRRKDDAEEETVPVVRLTRCEVPAGSPALDTPANPGKATKRRTGSSSSTKDELEEKPASVRRGRGRPTKVVEPEETPSVSSSVEEAPRRTNAVRRAKTATTPIIDASDDSSATEVEAKKPSARRTAAKRSADKLEAVPEEKKNPAANKPGLDDVEMLHAGKGHASDIHAHHTPEEADEEPEEQEEKEEKSPPAKGARATRSKKALKVHFDAAPSPAKTARGKKGAVSPDRRVSVRLERDPQIETLAAASIKEEDDGAKATKRPRMKRTTTVAEPAAAAPGSPAKPTKRPRGKKAEADPAPVESSPPPAPSPRRTRRTRN